MPTLAEHVTSTLDGRATPVDDRTFHIIFAEFNGAEGVLAFSDKEARLPMDKLAAIATERYGALRQATCEEHGWTPEVIA